MSKTSEVLNLIGQARYSAADALISDLGLSLPEIVEAWLEVGEVKRARRIFDLLPHKGLEHRLLDLEEIERFGFSVYPSEMPISKRWTGPWLASSENLVAWYPGKVEQVYDDPELGVLVARWVDPVSFRVMCKQFSESEWLSWGGVVPTSDPLFIELAVYRETSAPSIFTFLGKTL